MTTRWIAAACAMLLTAFSGSSIAKDWTEVRLATEGAFPPFNMTAADGSVRGLDVDIGNAVCAELQLKCVWVRQEWDGMIPALISRKFDAILASMSITEERKAKVDFTHKYYSSPLALIARKGSTLLPDTARLKGKRIGVQRGTIADNYASRYWADAGVDIVRYAKQESVYLDLASGRLDASFSDYWEAWGGILSSPEGAAYAVTGPKVYGRNAEEQAVIGEGIGIAVRKRDQELKELLNKGIAAIRANGTYARIVSQYFSEDVYGE